MVSPFVSSLVDVAQVEYRTYDGHKETDPVLGRRIEEYWSAVGRPFPGVDTPWSGVFISWCLKTAGATGNEFRFSAMHAVYVHWAIAQAGKTGALFQGMPFDAEPPRIGDLLQWNQPGHDYDFAYAADNPVYPSHVAIVVALRQDQHGAQAVTVGGNENNGVGLSRVPLDADFRVRQRERSPFMTLIRTLK